MEKFKKYFGNTSFLIIYSIAAITLFTTILTGYNFLNTTVVSIFICLFAAIITQIAILYIYITNKSLSKVIAFTTLIIHSLILVSAVYVLISLIISGNTSRHLNVWPYTLGIITLLLTSLSPAYSAFHIARNSINKQNNASLLNLVYLIPIILFNLAIYLITGYFVLIFIYPSVFGISL